MADVERIKEGDCMRKLSKTVFKIVLFPFKVFFKIIEGIFEFIGELFNG